MSGRAPVVELVGPPGAGKTTLTQLLLAKRADLRVETWPYFRRLRDDAFFVRSGVSLFPVLLRLRSDHRNGWLRPRDAALMAILQRWDRELERMAVRGGKVIILEEGAICLLAKLRAFGAEGLKAAAAAQWWEETYRRWASTLDLIIVLEASIPTLLARIRGREQQYEIGTMTDQEAVRYLNQIDAAERAVLAGLSAVPHGPEIRHFDTEARRLDHVDIPRMVR